MVSLKLKNACDKHNKTYYPRYKKWCDSIFIYHIGTKRYWRNFFDYKKDNYEKDFSFIKDVGLNFKEILKRL